MMSTTFMQFLFFLPELAKQNYEYVIPAHERRMLDENMGKMGKSSADYEELNLSKRQTDDGTYQKLLKQDSDCVIPADEGQGMYEDMNVEKSPPDYEELNQSKRETGDGTYQKLVKQDTDYVIPAHERRHLDEDVKVEKSQSHYEELNQRRREVEERPVYQSLVKT